MTGSYCCTEQQCGWFSGVPLQHSVWIAGIWMSEIVFIFSCFKLILERDNWLHCLQQLCHIFCFIRRVFGFNTLHIETGFC